MTHDRPRAGSILLACFLLVAVWILGVFLSTAVAAEGGLEVKIREAKLDPAGGVRLVVSASGAAVDRTLGAPDFTVTEAGKLVESLAVEPLLQTEAQPVAVALVVDVSGSLAGQSLADARAAAQAFLSHLPPQVQVALVTFGSKAEVRAGFTTDRDGITQMLATLEAKGETALYDGIALAAEAVGRLAGQHNIVVFSDGRDTVSTNSLEGAVAAATGARAPVTVVSLQTRDFDAGAIGTIAARTGGANVTVGGSQGLATAFQQVAREIASQYVLTYSNSRTTPKDLDLVVKVAAAGSEAADTVTVPNPRTVQAATAPHQGGAPPAPGFATSKVVLYGGIAAAFLAVALIAGTLLWRPGDGRAARVLRRGLSIYTRGARGVEPAADSGIAASAIGRRASELVGRLPQSKGYLEGLQSRLDRSGWPLRSTEFVLLQVVGVLGGALGGAGLLGRLWLGLVLAAFGAVIPQVLLSRRTQRRHALFLTQLPDTLQLLAASITAGYALMQAIDTVAKESPAPTSTELTRVLAEARLGMPLEEALSGMADRVGSEDFRWVVLAINIQHQVGGNLAELLRTVAGTLRERDQVRRQVKVLSAEGRLSAWILVVLPFLLVGYLLFTNPAYLRPLLENRIGLVMIATAVGLLGVGGVWLRKLIRIDV